MKMQPLLRIIEFDAIEVIEKAVYRRWKEKDSFNNREQLTHWIYNDGNSEYWLLFTRHNEMIMFSLASKSMSLVKKSDFEMYFSRHFSQYLSIYCSDDITSVMLLSLFKYHENGIRISASKLWYDSIAIKIVNNNQHASIAQW